MKVRKCFVSNSSSSAFLVPTEDLSQEQVNILSENDFFETNTRNPTLLFLEASRGSFEPVLRAEKEIFWGLYVGCNQEEVIELLVQAKIPFKGHGQYGIESYWYKPEWDHVLVVPNPGIHMLIYGEGELKYPAEVWNLMAPRDITYSWPTYKIPLDQYLPLEGPPTREEWVRYQAGVEWTKSHGNIG